MGSTYCMSMCVCVRDVMCVCVGYVCVGVHWVWTRREQGHTDMCVFASCQHSKHSDTALSIINCLSWCICRVSKGFSHARPTSCTLTPIRFDNSHLNTPKESVISAFVRHMVATLNV